MRDQTTAQLQMERKPTAQHPRPRYGKTRDDKLPEDKRTRGNR